MAYIEPKDGTKPMYGSISLVSQTDNSITIRIAANSVLSTTINIPILLQLNSRSIDDGTTIEKIFTELTTNWNKLYVKDSSVSQPLYTDTWDDTNNFARVWVILDSLTTAQKDLVIEFDDTSTINTINTLIGVNIETKALVYADKVNELAPILYYRLGESVGATTAIDETSNSYDGTYLGSLTLEDTSKIVNEPENTAVFFNITGELDFDSHGAMVSTSNPWSLSFIVSFNATNTRRVVCELRSDGASGIVIDQSSMKIRMGSDDTKSVFTAWTTASAVGSQWDNISIVITYDGVSPTSISSFKLYANGVSQTLASLSPWGTGSNLYNRLGSYYHEGYSLWQLTSLAHLDEFAIFDSELTVQDATDLYDLTQ